MSMPWGPSKYRHKLAYNTKVKTQLTTIVPRKIPAVLTDSRTESLDWFPTLQKVDRTIQ